METQLYEHPGRLLEKYGNEHAYMAMCGTRLNLCPRNLHGESVLLFPKQIGLRSLKGMLRGVEVLTSTDGLF